MTCSGAAAGDSKMYDWSAVPPGGSEEHYRNQYPEYHDVSKVIFTDSRCHYKLNSFLD